MLDIDSLRNEYDTYIRNWFLTNFEGCYCYKDNEDAIIWEYYYCVIILVEYNNFFICFNNAACLSVDKFKKILKKKFIKINYPY